MKNNISKLIDLSLSFYINTKDFSEIYPIIKEELKDKKYFIDFSSKLIESTSSREECEYFITKRCPRNTKSKIILLLKDQDHNNLLDIGISNNKILFRGESIDNLSNDNKYRLKNRLYNLGLENSICNLKDLISDSPSLSNLISSNKRGKITIVANSLKEYISYLRSQIPNNIPILVNNKDIKNRLSDKSIIINPDRILNEGTNRAIVIISLNDKYIDYKGDAFSISLNGEVFDYKIEVS